MAGNLLEEEQIQGSNRRIRCSGFEYLIDPPFPCGDALLFYTDSDSIAYLAWAANWQVSLAHGSAHPYYAHLLTVIQVK